MLLASHLSFLIVDGGGTRSDYATIHLSPYLAMWILIFLDFVDDEG
jgi:hypothetical protein